MAAKHLVGAIVTAVLAAATSQAMAQEVSTVAPEAKSFKLGSYELASLRDSGIEVANDGSVFGLNATPTAVTKVLADAGAPSDKVHLDVDALLVVMPGHKVLIDTGLGPSVHGVLKESLGRAGVSPADVTDVLITHAHNDHIGGLVDAEGKPAFPKATVRLSANEWTFMQHSEEGKKIAAAVAGQVKTFEPGREILPGITPVALYGHTPGHVVYRIESGGQQLVDIGDTAHSSIISLAKPDWFIEFDTDRTAGAAQRRRELQDLAASHTPIFQPHFPYPGVGRVEPAGDGFVFRPGLPSQKAP